LGEICQSLFISIQELFILAVAKSKHYIMNRISSLILILSSLLWIIGCSPKTSTSLQETEQKTSNAAEQVVQAAEAVSATVAPKTDFKLDYEKYTLDNGLDVVLHTDKSDPIVSVAILFHVGSNREKPGRTGFAHFYEHMLFQASENVGKGKFFKNINEYGGDFNGGTWNDGTIYYEVIPKDALEKVLWMEADRMGFFINTVTVAALENEKQVVKNEKRQRVDNRPYGHTSYVIDKAMFPEGHPYNWQVIGSLEDLQNATLEDVVDFYEKWYGPNNATLVVAGDIDESEVKGYIKKYFDEIPSKQAAEPLKPQPGVLNSTVSFYHEDNFAKLPKLTLVFPTVEDKHPDTYALDYLGALLSEGKRAPLYQEIVEKTKLAPETSSYNRAQEIAGKFYISITANEGVDLDDLHRGVFAALENFEANGIDDKDMERIKNKQETNFYNGVSSLLSKSFQLASYNVFNDDPGYASKEIEKILAVTKEDIMRVYEKYIKEQKYIATSFVPKGNLDLALEGSTMANVVEEKIVPGSEKPPMDEGDLSNIKKTPSKLDRTIEPPFGKAPTIDLPEIYSGNLSNGMKFYGIENNELPLVAFSIRLKGGLALDNPNKIGAANLITDLLMEGTASKTPEQLEDAIGVLGANISMSTSPEYITINGNCLARNYEKVMSLVQEMILEPRWDGKEFARIKESTITQIQQQSVQPNQVARNLNSKLLYGSNNIFSNNTMGTIESVERLSMDEVQIYYQKAFSPSVASFHVVGDVSETRVRNTLKAFDRNWEAKAVAFPEFIMPPAPTSPKLYFYDIPNAKQSVIRIFTPYLPANHPEFHKGVVVNKALGGGSSGKLFQILREDKGYTYGAYSFFPRRIDNGFFGATSSVRSNVTLESVQTFTEILKNYKNDFSADDLEKTQNSMLKSNALAFETLGKKLGVLQNISTYDLPMDYIKNEEQILAGMTLATAKETIGKYMDANKMVYLVIGDKASQFENLKKAGLGTPILIDENGQPIK